MKIISKYKDYYDYYVSKYGVDDLAVLDRREGKVLFIKDVEPPTYNTILTFAICGQLYDVVVNSAGKIFHGEEIKTLKSQSTYNPGKESFYIEVGYRRNRRVWTQSRKTNLNDLHNCPILLLDHIKDTITKFPRLENFEFYRMIKPEDMWVTLYQWLMNKNTEQENISTEQTDKEKIIAKGFHIKKSFRHRK